MSGAWIDATEGIAGDMLLGALVDAGADLEAVRDAVDAVLPGAARLTTCQVTRAGLRATKVDVDVLVADPPHRPWSDLRDRICAAPLPELVRRASLEVFARLAGAEARAHGVLPEAVAFHEVGAVDSVADVIGCCAALHALGVERVVGSRVAVGSGRFRTAHGELTVPGPAVAELSRGWRVVAGGSGESTTPTGMALLTTLSYACDDLPAMTVRAIGVGAGTRDPADHPNITRLLVGEFDADAAAAGGQPAGEPAVLLEANMDDVDPRVWPAVLAALLDAGASDAWLVPILMKKGRPAHVLTVLAAPALAETLRALVFRHTSTFGLRESRTVKRPLSRGWVDVDVDGCRVPVKVAHDGDALTRVTPEFDDIARAATDLGLSVLDALDRARVAAAAAGLCPGSPVPPTVRPSLSDGSSRT